MTCPFSAAGRFEERRRDADQQRAYERMTPEEKARVDRVKEKA